MPRKGREIKELIQESKSPQALAEKNLKIRERGGQEGNQNASKEETNRDNVTVRLDDHKEPTRGNSRQYKIRRLQKAAERDPTTYLPTYQQVLNGALKPHTALKLVGLVKDPTPLEYAQKAVLRLSAAEQEAFRDWYGTQQTG